MAGNEDSAASPETPREDTPTTSTSNGSRTGLRIGGWILAGLGALALIGGVALVVVHLTQRGKNGYYTSSTKRVAASGYAITTEGLDIGDLPSFTTDAVGHVRVSARGSNGQPLFVGIAPQSAVNAYLAGVGRSEVTDVNGDTVSYRTHPGGPPASPPARQNFWRAARIGTGEVTTTWKVTGGTWVIVLMNATATSNVNAAVSVGVKTNLVLWIGLGLVVVGLIFGGAGTAMIFSARPPRPTVTSSPVGT